MKKLDVIIIISVLTISVGIYLINSDTQPHGGIVAEIYADGELYGEISLSGETEDVEIITKYGRNTLHADADGVKMIYANCANQTCVNTPKQSQPGGVIACLPNRVLIKLKGDVNGSAE